MCPPPSCLRLGVVSVMSFFCSLCPLSPPHFSLCSSGLGDVFWEGGRCHHQRGRRWHSCHNLVVASLGTTSPSCQPQVGLMLLLGYMGIGKTCHCPIGRVCTHRLFKEHNDSLVDHVPKEREALLEREFQRVTISGEEKCGVSLPLTPLEPSQRSPGCQPQLGGWFLFGVPSPGALH